MKTNRILVIFLLVVILPLLLIFSYKQNNSCPCHKPTCSISSFLISSCKYENGNVKLTLQNQGFADISILNIYFVYPNGTRYSRYLTDKLPAFQNSNFELKGVSPGFQKINITTECNQLFAAITSEKCT